MRFWLLWGLLERVMIRMDNDSILLKIIASFSMLSMWKESSDSTNLLMISLAFRDLVSKWTISISSMEVHLKLR